MAHALATESQLIAIDLHQVLKKLDPARWRDGLEDSFRVQLVELTSRLKNALEGSEQAASDPALSALRDRLQEIRVGLEQHLPAANLPGERIRDAWNDFRLEILPCYEGLAANLHRFDIHIPSLRPTNYARNLWHASSGILAIVLVEKVFTVEALIPLAGAFFVSAWTMEISRRFSPAINRLLMRVFSPFAHPHEAFRVNSATWFTSALFTLSLMQNAAVISAAISILALADPAAALVGRRFGRHPLVHGRTVEGSLAFIVVGTLSALGCFVVFHPELSGALWIALAGSTIGALAELFSRRIDDNLSIPVCSALGMLAVITALGL